MADKGGKKSTKTATYTYDLLGRIQKETKTGSEDISYTYDSNNNRKEMKVGNKVTAYRYNKNDELLRTDTLNTDTEEDSVVIYKNDKNGNQLATVNRYEIPSDKKDSTYIDIDVTLGDNRLNENVVNHYNALNQLTQTLTRNYKVSFTYDAEGLRTSKTVNGEKTVFVWDGDQLVMELSEGGKVQKRYIRGNDLVCADMGENTKKQYYVADSHGNVVQLADENGKVIKTYEYDSFGNEVKPDRKDENLFRYCGEYYDKETEEVYLRARYYQPGLGRFLTRDSYTGEEDEPLSLHLYTYCGNDGVNSIDPSGHKIKLVKGGTEEQKNEYKRAKKYLKTSKTGKKLIKKLHKSKKVVKIKFINGGVNDEYDDSKRTIYWDHRDGGVFKYKKVVTSAALALAHEMGHAAQHLDGQINKKVSKVEKANLKKYEAPIAGQLGEPIRSYYKEISGTRKMNNSTHYITSHQHPYKPWKSYICHHNQWPVVGTTIGPAK